MSETLYIIDSHSHLYASYFAIPNLTAPDGEPTGALYGFTNAVLKILRDKRPHYMVAVYDGPEETFRKKAYADYKVTRKPMPDDLAPQIERSKEVVALLGVRAVDAPGYEADDLVALFTERARRGGCQVVIVSRDKDLMQLLGPGVVMYDTRKDLVMDAAWLEAEKGLRPEQIVDWLGLMGDASDNIPGVPGIGQKRAVALLQQWGSMDEILAHADQVKGKMGQSLRENAELARLSRGLATLTTDIPVDLTYQDLAVAEPDREKVAALFKQLAFKKLAEQFALPTAPLAQSAAAAEKKQFECVTTKAALKKLAAKLNRAKVLAFDTELTGLDPLRDRLVGLSFSTAAGQGTYVPVLAPEGQEHLSLATVTEAIGPVMANARSLKVAHNAKFDLAVLATAGITVRGPLFDTMIASYLLDPGSRRHGLDPLAEEHLAYLTVPISELIGEKKRGAEQKTMDQVPLEQITNYAAEDAEVTLGLYEVFAARLNDQGRGQGNLSKLFWDVEMPLVRVLEKMERQGVALDLDLLADLSRKFGRRMDKLRQEIHREAGREFNVDSPKQLAEVLFDEIGLKPVRKTKTGFSTDSHTLEALASQHPLPAKVLAYRTLAKLKGTYIDALPELINPDTGRIHASFNQAAVATGRLSSSNPNLQNIPIRTEEGRQIRAAFIPGDTENDLLLSADYSQVELRLLAHFSQDPFLLEAFENDLDIHAFVAAEVFGVPQSEVTAEQRARAKAVNFSLIYGKTAYGLGRDLGLSVGQAQDFIDAYFARYTRVREFMIEVLEGAKKDGYVSTILGRRRPTPGVKHTDARRWNNAERAAFNTVLQGSAADLIKVAMNNIDRRITDQSRPSRLILQVHDELVFEVPRKAVQDEREMIVEEMTTAIALKVPMKVDVSTGSNWREAK